MRLRKRFMAGICGLWCLLSVSSLGWGQTTLTSVQKVGGKSWALLTFDGRVQWIGISQLESNKLTLYLRGSAGDLHDASISIGPSNRAIQIQQMSRNPMVCRADIVCDGKIPLAVLKRGQNILVAMNGNTFLDKQSAYPVEDIQYNGRLINVAPVIQGNQVITTLDFDDEYDLSGYMRMSNKIGILIFNGARLGDTESDYSYDMSALKRIRFIPQEGETPGVRAMLSFESLSLFSIVKQPQSLMIQTPHVVETSAEVLVAEEEAAVPDLVVTQELPLESTELSLDQILAGTDSGDQGVEEKQDETPTEAPPLKTDADVSLPTSSQTALTGAEARDERQTETGRDALRTISDIETIPDEEHSVEPGLTEMPQIEETQFDVRSTQEQQKEVVRRAPQERVIPWDEEVSFEFVNQSIVNALRLIAGANELNMVIDEGVEGTITMDLKGVTLRQAIEKIVYTHDCEYIVDQGIITVKPVDTVYSGGSKTKIYRLKYADAENVANVIKQIVSSDSLVQVFHPEFLNYTEAGKNRMDKNKVAVQGIRRSSTLVVTDRPEKILEVDRIVEELDRPPTQIIIESKLVELAPIKSNELGINWDKTVNMMLWGQKILDGGDEVDYSFFNETPDQNGQWKMANLSAGKYQAVLDFLKEKTDSKLKSNPRLLAMDNEESSISVGTTVPVPRIQRGLGGQGDMVTFEYKEVNIQLNVTPHVAENDRITMYVNPVIEEITGWVEYMQHRAPITDKRSVNSIVTVKNGETVVIGGLIKSQRLRTTSKVWLLGSIPLIGRLFQHEQYEDKQTDLMIFITPTIMR